MYYIVLQFECKYVSLYLIFKHTFLFMSNNLSGQSTLSVSNASSISILYSGIITLLRIYANFRGASSLLVPVENRHSRMRTISWTLFLICYNPISFLTCFSSFLFAESLGNRFQFLDKFFRI